jgi:diaminohydroxyphosphoribosylaminopyrimidine deaminase/5-amino-6-(5-phosphoribosylamino)uracil reductase
MNPMQRALSLAEEAIGTTRPNPSVGAVLMYQGDLVGEGATHPPGGPHAEIIALGQAGSFSRGATLYVTMEPCAHHGRTPPCTEALVKAGIAEVHMASLDPNPKSGNGRNQLEAAGIRTFLEEPTRETEQLYEAHTCYADTGLPFVIAKFAMSLDGKIATRTGPSQWITSDEARLYSNELRGRYDSIMVGIGTILQDDPRLTWRKIDGESSRNQPLRIIVDSHGRTPNDARVLTQPGKTLIVTASESSDRLMSLQSTGAEIVSLPSEDGRVHLRNLLRFLGEQEITSVIAEGGNALLGSLFDEQLVDKVMAFTAPSIIGGRDAPSPIGGLGVEDTKKALTLTRVSLQEIGQDYLITGYCMRK